MAIRRGAPGARTNPSIPSKFETVFNRGAEEADGFQRRTHRFTSAASDVPGPGHYSSGAKNTTLLRNPASTSTRGYGVGFASKVGRFQYKESTQAPPAAPPTAPQREGESSERATRPTAAFVRPQNHNPQAPKRASMPGPGAYEAKTTLRLQGPGASSAFKSSSNRFKTKQDRAGSAPPGPGWYEIGVPGTKVDMAAADLPSAAFRSRTGRGAAQRKRSSGLRDIVDFPLDPTFGFNSSANATVRQHARRAGLQPGPGSYDPKLAPQFTMSAQRKSSFFSNDALDRFGRSVLSQFRAEEPSPGPGHYTGSRATVAPPTKGAAASAPAAVFKSASPRFKGAQPRKGKPGPADYNPSKLDGRSFHLNLSRRWV